MCNSSKGGSTLGLHESLLHSSLYLCTSDIRIYKEAHGFDEKLDLLTFALASSNVSVGDAASLLGKLCFNSM